MPDPTETNTSTTETTTVTKTDSTEDSKQQPGQEVTTTKTEKSGDEES
ncbi:hypothetical protein [Spirosoma spitsbergense]|nr:hypothetical protein [Spirosoma spitsbergense]